MPGEQPGAHAGAGLADLDEKPPGGVAVAGRRQLDFARRRIAVEQGADQLKRIGLRASISFFSALRVNVPLRSRRRFARVAATYGEPRLLLGVALGRQLGETS